MQWRFNPSFGILLIQTFVGDAGQLVMIAFQSLVRDSAHSDHHPCNCGTIIRCVSIPRSGFCSFRLDPIAGMAEADTGFNPSFGILLIQTSRLVRLKLGGSSFNPSFGILLIQTGLAP